MPRGHSRTPIGDCAGWILLGDTEKLAFGFVVPEGVKKGDTARECFLNFWLAGVLKVHGSELGRRSHAGFMVFVLRDGREATSEQKNESKGETELCHLKSPT